MNLEEARKVLLLYAITNVIAPFWKGRKKSYICYFYITLLLYYIILYYIQAIYNLNGIAMY